MHRLIYTKEKQILVVICVFFKAFSEKETKAARRN